MVDVSEKRATLRVAVAEGKLLAPAEVMTALRARSLRKGDALGVARLAGLMAAKRTADLIPLCHSLPLSLVDVHLTLQPDHVLIRAECRTRAATGVEMEALTAVSVAALALYDMCKAVSQQMTIADVRLLSKSGGKLEFRRPDP